MGLSIYEGIRAILHGETEHRSVPWILRAVLAVSLCIRARRIEELVSEIGTAIPESFPDIGRIFIEVQSREDHTGLEAEARRTG